MGQAVGQTGATTVFELREYHAAEGKLDALLARSTAALKAMPSSLPGNDEMEEACGDGWAELQPDGTVEGQILHPWW